MIRNRLFAAIALACALTGAACEDGDPTGPTGEVPGTYSLETVNGEPLPYEVFAGEGFSFEVLADTIEVGAVNTFRHWTTLRETTDTEVLVYTDTITGTYDIDGSRITFSAVIDGEPDETSATLRGTTIRFGGGLGPVAVYQRHSTLD